MQKVAPKHNFTQQVPKKEKILQYLTFKCYDITIPLYTSQTIKEKIQNASKSLNLDLQTRMQKAMDINNQYITNQPGIEGMKILTEKLSNQYPNVRHSTSLNVAKSRWLLSEMRVLPNYNIGENYNIGDCRFLCVIAHNGINNNGSPCGFILDIDTRGHAMIRNAMQNKNCIASQLGNIIKHFFKNTDESQNITTETFNKKNKKNSNKYSKFQR